MNFVRFLNSFCKNTRGRRMAKTQNSEGPPPPLVEPVLVPRPRMVHFRTNKSQYLSRSRFMFLVYCLAFVLLIVALIQWEFVSHTKDLTDFFLDKCLVSIVCMLVAIPLMAVFLLVRAVRYLPILGWLLVLVIVELLVVGICTLAANCDGFVFLALFGLTAVLVVVSLLIGSCIPCDLTKNVAKLFIVCVLLFHLALYLLMLYMLIIPDISVFLAFSFLVVLVVCLLTCYHAQLIRGRGYADIPTTEGLFAVTVLFCYFCKILMIFCFWDRNRRVGDLMHREQARGVCGDDCTPDKDMPLFNGSFKDFDYDNDVIQSPDK
ncbi:uncharacterized protein Dana_GF24796, isoform C [Drosophila ananassae]|uniref:Uncharacterized protein, isoform C n=1 Tax=Drosophila ananassae TaxID=7217 RepID=B3M7X3_DROAN|nr:uncharacterized protein LOC6507426 isoform X1 [Drosophila ananassae]EDV38846.2 uncharacterized protein Dana_GF24796, isoform C [Drosophila ananassae]